MMSNGYTMYCETSDCAFHIFTPTAEPENTLPDVLSKEEVERIYREGVGAQRRGLQFHEGPYAKPGTDAPDDEYQRGVEWRRGWNDAALGEVEGEDAGGGPGR
jgi:hypothetical protein